MIQSSLKANSSVVHPEALYDVEIYNDKSLLGVVTVTAKSPEDASNVAVQGINVKIKRAYT